MTEQLLKGKPCPKCGSTDTKLTYVGSGIEVWVCYSCGHHWDLPAPSHWREGT